jgi:hypothetical protein
MAQSDKNYSIYTMLEAEYVSTYDIKYNINRALVILIARL